MSWPGVKPPWTHLKWFEWGNPLSIRWPQAPAPEWSSLQTVVDTSGTLYFLKQEIETHEAAGEWEFLKRSSNPYELVFSQSQDNRIPMSVCSLRPLSRSFFKMIELLHVLDFFKRHSSSRLGIQSSHVCEGPGGFIEALQYMSHKNNYKLENEWAMTLKPTKANIPGWRRAYNFLRRSPMVHIEYGADETGDILVPANQKAFIEKTGTKCSLFTADGGFDFSEHYSTQEDEVFPLLVSSALIGIQSMVKGGDFILKLFDIHLPCTQQLIALLAYCFDSWTLYKPALSRPCNAEKYFLGRGCRFIPKWIIQVLSQLRDGNGVAGSRVQSIFPRIPETILADIHLLQNEFIDQQTAALKYALSHKQEWNNDHETIWKSIQEHSIQWCRQFQMPLRSISV